MSNINQISRIAFLVSAAISLAACSDSGGDVSGGGGEPLDVADDSCDVVLIADNATSYSDNMADLVDSTEVGQYQYSVAEQPTNGTVTIDPSTGDYEFMPNSTLVGARGFKASFTYGVLEDGEQVDTGVVELIYGAKRIMPLGDSITFGVTFFDGTDDNPAPAFAVGYRKVLFDRLISEGFSIDFVGSATAGTDVSIDLDDTDHQGTPGLRAGADVDHPTALDSSIVANLNANESDIILSHAGTNDLFQDSPAGELGPTDAVTTAVAGVNSLIANMQTWRSNQADQPLTVLSAKIIPSYALGGNTSSLLNSTIASFNSAMESDLTATFSSNPNFNVEIVDHFSALNASTDLTTRGGGIGQDSLGLHPNTSGYTKMANTWYDAIIATGELEKCE